MVVNGGGLKYHLYQFLWAGVDLLHPPTCPGCQARHISWCPQCRQKTHYLLENLCEICGQPQERAGRCSRCQSDPPAFDAARALAVFNDPLRQAIHRLKYHGDGGLGEALAASLIALLQKLGWRFDLVVPVPLGKARLHERGYNQAAWIALPIALFYQVPYRPKALQRVRETRSQVDLSLVERQENVRGAFSARAKDVSGRTLLLVDDVMTTGSTLNACAHALKEAGAERVYALTLARAVLDKT